MLLLIRLMTVLRKPLVMNRDTEELRAIMLEMEADMKAIEGHQCVSHRPLLKDYVPRVVAQ
jgi:hypothetical protein